MLAWRRFASQNVVPVLCPSQPDILGEMLKETLKLELYPGNEQESHEKGPCLEGNVIFQPSIFRGKYNPLYPYLIPGWLIAGGSEV